MVKESTIHALRPGFQLRSKDRTYEIVKVLGCGSFGVTYLATSEVSVGNISTSMRFAIKEHFMSASCYRGDDGATVLAVPTAKSDVVDSRADFITEANRLKKLCLKSRNIVSVNETFEANGTAYYVMEFLDGGSPSKCSEDDAVSIVKQIADALNEIHQEKVLHLDVKPDNIVMKRNEKGETYPVLIDFGISKHFDSKNKPTSSLSAKGASPGYAPQEQYAGVTEFTPKFDIYALGAVLFFLCTGKNPPDAFKISPNQQELKGCLAGVVSPKVEKAILNAMKPNAYERTATIKQFCDDLMGVDFVPVLNVSSSRITFDKDKGRQSITVDSNIGWDAFADSDWCRVSKDGNNVVVTASKNKAVGSRSCGITVRAAAYPVFQTVHVKQEGTGTVVFPKDPSWWKQNSKRIYQVGAVALAGICIASIMVFIKPNPETESQKLTEAIEDRDINTLRKFAEIDSVRAFKPLIRALKKSDLGQAKLFASKYAAIDSVDYLIPMVEICLKEGDYDNAKLYVNKYLAIYPSDNSIQLLKKDIENQIQQEIDKRHDSKLNSRNDAVSPVETVQNNQPKVETNDEKFARASNDFNLMLSLAKDNYAKAYYPIAEMYYNKRDSKNAKAWAQKAISANVNRKQAQTLISKIDKPSPSNEELFANARTLEDFKTLADKGYSKAYAPLAEQYLKQHQYDNAHQWAVKAGRAKVGLDKARKVFDVLNSYGYYDNDEHGGKPNL